MRRIAVVGNSGSGKSTLARDLAERIEGRHVELDSIYHQPGWTPLEPGEFVRRVTDAVAVERWVVDGNYRSARDVIWPKADAVVWVDLPKPVVMTQLVRRTLRRMATREELWNGNRERWRNLFSRDPAESIIVWARRNHDVYRAEYGAALEDPAWASTRMLRLRSRSEVAAFVAQVPAIA